jgi:disulfide bond formation protein DsbB
MTLEVYSTILTLGSIGIFVALLGLLLLSLTTKTGGKFTLEIRYEQYIALIAAISITSIVFSLTYQLVYETPVCELCWWQRIFLYPVSVITLVALWFRTRETHVTTAILAGLGFYIACYHYYYHFQGYVLGKTLSLPCSYGGLLPACTKTPVLVFGFATIPFMGIMVFGSFLILTWFAYKVRQQKSSESESLLNILATTPTQQETIITTQTETIVTASPEPVTTNSPAPHKLYGAVAVAVLLVIVAFLFTRGYIVAATVNGQPIGWLAVVSKLEDQDGKKTLEAMVNERILNTEFEKLGITIEAGALSERIAEIETQVSAQGGTLAEALAQQGMTMKMLEAQIESQLKIEKALGDKIKVTDAEVTAYLAENGIEAHPDETPEQLNAEIAEQLKQQKIQMETQAWITAVTDKAEIKYYVRY